MSKQGAHWKQQDMMLDNKWVREFTFYTMEAWCTDNPAICAYVQLYCYEGDDINRKDINDMRSALIKFINKKHPDTILNFKCYDQRGVSLTVRGDF